jgi:pimeloyl-ACP methyl ester carboxylesterase
MAVKTTSRNKKTLTEAEQAEARSYFSANNLLVDPPVKRAAYSDRMAWVLASMSQLVYENFEEGGKAQELLLEKLKGGGFKWIRGFNSVETDTQAFLVVKEDLSYAVLAFRGTEVTKTQDIKTDAMAAKISDIEGRVHRGFLKAYESVEKEIVKFITALEGVPLYITGHSLGAALATLATQRLEQDHVIRDQIAACYTFGSPRVGNTEFDRELKSVVYRVVNTTDIVTVVPLLAMGYIHAGDVRFLERAPGEFRRGYIPFLQRLFFFVMAAFRLFGPLVGDHGIAEYRKKLEAIAQDRNLDLYYDGLPKSE